MGTHPEAGAEPCQHTVSFGTERGIQLWLGPSQAASWCLASAGATAQHPSGKFAIQECGSVPLKGVAAMQHSPKLDWMLSQPLITPVST